jgi:hypothetical protein
LECCINRDTPDSGTTIVAKLRVQFLLLMSILESLRRYLSSAEWQEYIESFIEANCMKFLHANSEDFTHEQYSIWKVWLSSTFLEMDDFWLVDRTSKKLQSKY